MGQLIELDAYRRPKAPKVMTESEKKQFYRELLTFGYKRHYRPKWAAVQYRKRFGVWPPRDWESAPIFTPSPATINWVKSLWIARSKAHANEA